MATSKTVKCVGCDGEFPSDKVLRLKVAGLPEDKALPICRGRSYKAPKPDCLRKYWDRGLPCVGCGAEVSHNYGYRAGGDRHLRPICETCDDLLTEARRRSQDNDEKWYGLSSYEAFGGLRYGEEGVFSNFAKMLGFKGRCFIDSEPLLESRADNTGDAWLLLPRWQAEAARAFLQGLRKAIARSKSEAKEEGHALLVRLARGETTVADYEEELGQDRQGDD